MIQVGTRLKVADNTGAKWVLCVNIPGASKKLYARLGDLITGVVKDVSPEGMVNDAEVVSALIVRTKKEVRRKDGGYIRFDDNAVVLVDKQGNPRGTRIFGPVAREVKDLGYDRLASMAPELV